MHNSVKSAQACLSLLQAGSMRFRWNEVNEKRLSFFKSLFNGQKTIVPLELIHSKIVIVANNEDDTKNLQADGIITCNPNLVPVITVADCMPIYLWDPVTGCYGVLHSGWKGTGIVEEALLLANQHYGAKAENFQIIIGPHIKDCCYVVDEQRAQYFSENFTPNCIEQIDNTQTYRLSLEKANIHILEKIGVKSQSIYIVGECTCCSKSNQDDPIYGSFRRETAHFPPNSPIQEMQKHFTPMAAFMCVGEKTLKSTENFLVHNFI